MTTEKQHLQEGSDGKVHVSFNGIFTSPNAAAGYAVQHAKDKNEPLYFVVFPQADSALSELMVAGYQKFMENNFFGLTNSAQQAQNLMYSYGNTGLEEYGHSRGGMTIYNALSSLKQQNIHGLAGQTEINLYGPAANVQSVLDLLVYESDGKQTSVGLENHQYDFVGSVIGGNPATFYQVPPGSNALKEAGKIFWSYPNVHACYGHQASDACRNAYGDSYKHRKQIYSIKSGSKK